MPRKTEVEVEQEEKQEQSPYFAGKVATQFEKVIVERKTEEAMDVYETLAKIMCQLDRIERIVGQ